MNFDPAAYSDKRNNVEQVLVQGEPIPPGQWRIVVQSIGMNADQPFSIVVSMLPGAP